MTVARSAVQATKGEPPAAMVDRLTSFRLLPPLVFTALTVLWVIIALVASVSALWVLPAVIVSGVGVLVFFGSRFAWRTLN
jgi:hypothetical protein